MNKLLKRILCLMLSVIILVSAVACGNTDKTSASVSSAEQSTSSDAKKDELKDEPKEIQTLRIAMFADWYQQGWQAIEQDTAANAQKLGFKLEVDKLANGTQGSEILKVRASSNELPDMLAYPGPSTIDKDIRAGDKLVDISGEWVKNFDETILKSSYSFNGKITGLPYGGSVLPGVLYNKKVFSELGISIPNNWDEFVAVCEKIKASGKVAVFLAGKDAWTVQIMSIIGMHRDLKDKDAVQVLTDWRTNKIKTSDLKLFIDTIDKIKLLKDKGYVNKNWLSDNYDASQKALAEGEAAMVIQATWMLDEIKKKFPDKINDIGGFAMPFEGNDAVPAWIPNSVSVFNTSKYIDQCMSFIEYFGSVEGQGKYFVAQPGIPIIKGVNAELAPAAKELYDIFSIPGRGVTNWQSLPVVGPEVGDFPRMVLDAMIGSKTSAQVAETMQKEMEKDGRAKGLEGWK